MGAATDIAQMRNRRCFKRQKMQNLNEINHDLGSRVKQALLACRDVLLAYDRAICAEIILFGSVARGTSDAESDIDLLILVDKPLTAEMKTAIHGGLYEVSLAYDVVISSIIKTRQQWNSPVVKILPLYRTIEKEGIRVA